MGKRKLLKVLFFIAGPAATDDDTKAMQAFGQGHLVCQRNALKVHEDDAIEEFDIVAGAVPPSYERAAAEKGEPETPPIAPPVDPDLVPPGSPLEPPPVVDPPADPPAPPKQPEAPAKAPAKPKPPAPKPDAAKGWKPNA